MQEYTLRAGEELVIHSHINLSVLAIEEDEVVLGITTDPEDERGPETLSWRLRLVATSTPLPPDNGCRSQTLLARPQTAV
jgi:hypothetical protein